jgi:F0F1-type ATP synthase membrane subunit c/vacuolar-type H+-ATPase subunit K
VKQTRLFLGVVFVEVVVLIALWAFGRYFSS